MTFDGTNPFKAAVARLDARLVGTWHSFASPLVAEALGWCGYDFVVVDMEHAPAPVPTVLACLQALAGTPAQAAVRLPSHDPAILKGVLDAGAQTIIVPMVESVAEARDLVAATRYAPEGRRGYAGMQRASRFGAVRDYVHHAQEHICLVAQLESPGAVAIAAELARVEGIDALFFGPGDFSAASGLRGSPAAPEVRAAMAATARLCRELGRPIGTLSGSLEIGRADLDLGYAFTAVGSDLGLLTAEARRHTAALKT